MKPLLIALAVIATLVVLYFLGHVPLVLPIVYFVMSFISFFFYRADKQRASTNQWRIPEANLHATELLGGWPGALVAQQYLRHKNRKLSFQIQYWLIVVIHVVGIAWYCLAKPTL